MTTKKHMILIGVLAMLGGCVGLKPDATGNYTKPIGGAPVTSNETPYSDGLHCLARFATAGRSAPRIAVGNVVDYTGKDELDGGRQVTQGAALMAISALSKAGARLVERFDTAIGEMELQYANNKLIGGAKRGEYRKIMSGSIPGSDYYLVGGITELNYNIRSQGFDGLGGEAKGTGIKFDATSRVFVMNVGLDLRLVDTQSLEVVDVISYQKQIKGHEVSAGVFDILGSSLIDIGGGERALEPIQLAVRSVIERAVFEMMARLYDVEETTCAGAGPVSHARLEGATTQRVATAAASAGERGSVATVRRDGAMERRAPTRPTRTAPRPFMLSELREYKSDCGCDYDNAIVIWGGVRK